MTPTDRLYVCPGCDAPEHAPVVGGLVACSRCGTPCTLPNRGTLPTNLLAAYTPPEDAARLRHLRAQDGRRRPVSPTLQRIVGTNVQPGHERDALALWQVLRLRSHRVADSEDLAALTLMLVQTPATPPELCEALLETACDAVVLHKHRQEMLGPLSRMAAGRGDRARAEEYLGWMVPGAADLDTDSERRVSLATLATLDGSGQKVLALLGARKGAVPIADALAPVATVLRANAHELLGDTAAAAQVLRELPDPHLLTDVSASFPALLLCASTGPAYAAAVTKEAARRAAVRSGRLDVALTLVLAALVQFGLAWPHGRLLAITGGVCLGLGALLALHARARSKRAAWLRAHGVRLRARIVEGSPTGAHRDGIPVYEFALDVAGPRGTYRAMFEQLTPEHEVGAMLGDREMWVRANPSNLIEIIPED
jgi:hypothetical protein